MEHIYWIPEFSVRVLVWNCPRSETQKRLLVYEMDHAGHTGAHLTQWRMDNIESQYMLGFRNQDLVEADVAWEFFKGELQVTK